MIEIAHLPIKDVRVGTLPMYLRMRSVTGHKWSTRSSVVGVSADHQHVASPLPVGSVASQDRNAGTSVRVTLQLPGRGHRRPDRKRTP